MRAFVAAGVQIAPVPNDVRANLEKAVVWLERTVRETEAELVIFPETATTGFDTGLPPEALWDLVSDVPGPVTEPIQRAAKALGVHVVWPTYTRGPERGVVYNSAVLIGPDGSVIGVYHKTHPFPAEHVERGGWCTPGTRAEVFETALGTLGLMICYDGDFPELARVLAIKGAEVLVRPSALLRSFDIWQLTNLARAYDNHVYVLAVNAVGTDAAGNHYFGHSMFVSPIAWRLAQARAQEEILAARLDPDPLRYVSWGTRSLQAFDHLEDRNLEVYRDLLQPARSRFEPGRRLPHQARETVSR